MGVTGKVFELITRINQINKERDKLDIEYNQLVKELRTIIPSLENDENLPLREKTKRK